MRINVIYLSCLWLCLLIQFGCGKKSSGGSAAPAPETKTVSNLTSEELIRDLIKAVREEKIEVISGLLHAHQFFNINEPVIDGDTILIYSIKQHRVASREYLLKAGADPEMASENLRTYMLSPLMIAASEGHIHTVKSLISANVSLDRKDPMGNTALLLAIKNKKSDCALSLIKAGANTQIKNKYGDNAYSLAENKNLSEVSEFLEGIEQVGLGAPSISTYRNLILVGDVNSFRATLSNYPKLVKEYESINPLVLTVLTRDEFAGLSMAQILLDKELSPNGPSESDTTPLIEAVKNNKQIFADLFLKRGASIGRTDKEGKSALYHAVDLNNVEMVNYLVNNDAPIKYSVRVNNKNIEMRLCKVVNQVALRVAHDLNQTELNEVIRIKLRCR